MRRLSFVDAGFSAVLSSSNNQVLLSTAQKCGFGRKGKIVQLVWKRLSCVDSFAELNSFSLVDSTLGARVVFSVEIVSFECARRYCILVSGGSFACLKTARGNELSLFLFGSLVTLHFALETSAGSTYTQVPLRNAVTAL